MYEKGKLKGKRGRKFDLVCWGEVICKFPSLIKKHIIQFVFEVNCHGDWIYRLSPPPPPKKKYKQTFSINNFQN